MERNKEIKEMLDKFEALETKDVIEFFANKFRGSYPLLRILKNAKDDVTPGILAKKLGVTTARIAVMLCNLEMRKLLVRKRSAEDARKIIICITNEGMKKVDEMDKEVLNYLNLFFNKLSDEEVIEFKNIINKLIGE